MIGWRGGKGCKSILATSKKISTVLHQYDLLSEQEAAIADQQFLGLPINVIPWLYKFVEFATEHAPFAELNAKPSVRKIVGHRGDLSDDDA